MKNGMICTLELWSKRFLFLRGVHEASERGFLMSGVAHFVFVECPLSFLERDFWYSHCLCGRYRLSSAH